MPEALATYSTLTEIRDRVVALCGDVAGKVVLDVGCGDGLVGRALLPLVGAEGTVIFADHDAAALESLSRDLPSLTATTRQCDAMSLDDIEDASIDVVVMRAVLLYLPDKPAALAAARRVLRPGGRLVISEPVNHHLYAPAGWLWGYDLRAIAPIALKVRDGFLCHPVREVRAMTDWTEQDLFHAVLDAGFADCRMDAVTASFPQRPLPWLAFLHARWTPWMPSVAQVTRECLDVAERRLFEAELRPLVEQGRHRPQVTNLFLTGDRSRTPGDQTSG